MPDLTFTVTEERSRIGVLRTWLPRIAVAVAFLSVGYGKFGDRSSWIGIFDEIGVGQWFRYLTGGMQVTGAILVLIPKTCLAGIVMLACTMAGAAVVWIFVLHAPGNAVIPGAILVGLVIVGLSARQPR